MINYYNPNQKTKPTKTHVSTTTLTSGLVGRFVFCVFLLPAPSRIICASPSVGSTGHNGAKMQPSGATSSPHSLNWWSSGNDFKLGWNITKTTMPAIQNDSNLTQTHDDQCPPRFSMADPPLNLVITAPKPGSWRVCRPSIWKTTIWI